MRDEKVASYFVYVKSPAITWYSQQLRHTKIKAFIYEWNVLWCIVRTWYSCRQGKKIFFILCCVVITLAFPTKHNQGRWFLTVWGRVRQVSPRFSLSVNVWLAFGAWITSEECLHQNTGYAHVLKLPELFLFLLSFFHDCSKRSQPWSFLFLFLLSLSVHHNLSCSIKMSGCWTLWLWEKRPRAYPWKGAVLLAAFIVLTLCVLCVHMHYVPHCASICTTQMH